MLCVSCGQTNPDDAAFCGRCGASVTVLVSCPACDRKNPSDLNFCPGCGMKLGAHEEAPAAAPEGLTTTTLAGGRYEVRSFLGEGGRKRVYRAYDVLLEREVAIAVMKTEGLDEAGLSRLRREAQAMAHLGDNPHIVTVHDIGDDNGRPFIVSQHMKGGAVADLLANAPEHRLPVEQVASIGVQICDALEYAHARGILHRDIKPANIWLTADGTAKLGDFGLAVGLNPTRITVEGMIVGTLAYMPPELAAGGESEPRSDLYSLGAMLYEMLTGRPPFLGENAVAIISQHLNTAPVAPSWHNPEVPKQLEQLVLALLAKEPANRPADAEQVKTDLLAIQSTPAPDQAVPVPEVNPLDRLASGVFVGRSHELDELRAGLDETFRGRGGLVLLVGEPGIGKTRVADEMATYASLRGAQVLWGRCYEGEGAPVYWPWVQVIRSYVHEHESAALMSEMGSGAADIAQVVSTVREMMPDLPTPTALEPEHARFRLFDSIATFLKNAARNRPLVLILDDIQSADKPSLLLLQFLAREVRSVPLLIIATYRDIELGRHHPLAEALKELSREHLSRRVVLRGLDEADVARYIEMTTRLTPPPVLVAAIQQETEGNPFFVSEVVRLLAADGRLDHPEALSSWSRGIPQGIREVVGRRLDHLTDACNKALTIASIIGRQFDLDTLEAVFDAGGDALLDVIEEAVAARLIVEETETPGRYRFSHALVRETLYNDVGTTRRVRLHRQIAEALEGDGTRVERRLAELAYHFSEGAQAGDPEKAVAYASLAADRAMDVLAYEEAARLYEMALHALELGDADGMRRCELLIRLGDSQIKSGDHEKGQPSLSEAAALAKGLGRADRMAEAALALGGHGPIPGVVDVRQVGLLEDALAALEKGDSALKAKVMGRLTIGLYHAPDKERRDALSVESVEMARRVGDPEALTSTLNARRWALSGPEAIEERLAVATELVRAAEAVGDKELAVQGHLWALVDHLELGNIPAVDVEMEAYDRLAVELRQPLYRWGSLSVQVMRAALRGNLVQAEQLAEQARVEGQRGVAELAELFYGSHMFLLARDIGNLEEAEERLVRLVEKYPSTPLWRCELVNAHSLLGRDAQARDEFEELAVDDFAGIAADQLWLTNTALLAEVCDSLGDARRAKPLYEVLLPFEGRNVVVGRGGYSLGPVSRYLGLMATVMSRFDEAEGHFERALEMSRRMRATPWQAYARYDYARMLLRRGFVTDAEHAEDLLGESLRTARDLGMKVLVAKVVGMQLEARGLGTIDSTSTIDAVSSVVQSERPDLRGHTAPDGTVTIMFSDIEGSTQMTDRLGDHRWMEVLGLHDEILQREIGAEKGFVVKSAGDGFMVAFSSASRALRCCIAIQRALAAHNADQDDDQIRVRIGLHTGEAIRQADDFYGRNVILAARIGAAAQGGEILVSSVLKEMTESSMAFRFTNKRELELKGLSGSYTVYSVAWDDAAPE